MMGGMNIDAIPVDMVADLIAKFAEAHPEDARRIFDEARDAKPESALDGRAATELVREWYCNPAFRAGASDLVANLVACPSAGRS